MDVDFCDPYSSSFRDMLRFSAISSNNSVSGMLAACDKNTRLPANLTLFQVSISRRLTNTINHLEDKNSAALNFMTSATYHVSAVLWQTSDNVCRNKFPTIFINMY